jgi:hypothetical protein
VVAGLTTIPQLSGGVPKGYVRVLVFNADSALVSQQTQQLTSAALNNYEPLRLRVVVPQDGYVTAYVGNESEVDVYFDDVTVEHRQGLQVQETAYDPTGLELAGVTGSSPGLKRLNQYKFNGKEFQPDLGLNWNHQDWRFIDYARGPVWHGVDPMVEDGQESMSPYAFSFDNAVRFNDPDGRKPGDGVWNSSLGGLLAGAYRGVTSYASQANSNAQHLLTVMQTVTGGKEPTLGDKAAAYAHAYLSGGAGNYTDQNDVAVLTTGRHFDGNKATTGDKVFAGLGAAVPLIGGTLFKKAGAELLYTLKKTDADLRGTGVKFKDALSMAFEKTGIAKKEFEVTMWGKDVNGKAIPVEYRAKGGAEVSVDFAHTNGGLSPDAPHVGWQTPGKGTKQQRGHIILEQVPAGRTVDKLDKTVR